MKTAIAIHGGAGPDSRFIRKHKKEYEEALKAAVENASAVLEGGGTAVDAVETAIRYMEDCFLFNCGKGAALTTCYTVEMDSSIMEGKYKKHGSVAIVKNVKNPITLARKVMEQGDDVFIAAGGALEFAIEKGLETAGAEYFITEHQVEALEKAKKKEPKDAATKKAKGGTVGAVALDKYGNLAAGTSTGGTENCRDNRIGDSPVIGTGSYANNLTCAVSSSGDGAELIQRVVAYDISACIEYKGMSVENACRHVINVKGKDCKGDMGVIALNTRGEFAVVFNSERMHRAWRLPDGKIEVKIYE
jgi:beta-aspartyl-peptidase (threonine type)